CRCPRLHPRFRPLPPCTAGSRGAQDQVRIAGEDGGGLGPIAVAVCVDKPKGYRVGSPVVVAKDNQALAETHRRSKSGDELEPREDHASLPDHSKQLPPFRPRSDFSRVNDAEEGTGLLNFEDAVPVLE